MRTRTGSTLVEMMVVIAILAIAAAAVALALPASPRGSTPDAATQVAEARRAATSSGRPVRLTIAVGDDSIAVLAQPDGSILGAPQELADWAAGSPAHAR